MMAVRATLLGWLLAALAGAGIVYVSDPILYEFPEVYFSGLLDIFS